MHVPILVWLHNLFRENDGDSSFGFCLLQSKLEDSVQASTKWPATSSKDITSKWYPAPSPHDDNSTFISRSHNGVPSSMINTLFQYARLHYEVVLMEDRLVTTNFCDEKGQVLQIYLF